nr:MAG TPA: hypothetical protein [Caudoviricetes sp.]
MKRLGKLKNTCRDWKPEETTSGDRYLIDMLNPQE